MTDPQTLLSQAQCYMCLGVSLAQALEIALLAQIASGTSSGVGGVSSGVGVPSFTPSASTWIYFNTNDGTQYNYYSGAWH